MTKNSLPEWPSSYVEAFKGVARADVALFDEESGAFIDWCFCSKSEVEAMVSEWERTNPSERAITRKQYDALPTV